MTVTIGTQKPKVSMPVMEPAQDAELQAKVDRIGELQEIVDAGKAAAKEVESLKAELKEAMGENLAATSSASISGEHFAATLSAKATSRSIIDLKAVHEAMGDVFYEVASVPLKACDDYLTKPQRDKLLKTENTGARTLKVAALKK